DDHAVHDYAAPVRRRMEQHIRIVAILYIVLGALGLLAAIVVLGIFLVGAGAGMLSDEPEGAVVSGTCGMIIAVVVALISLPNLIAGLGLQKRRKWARILTIVLSVLNLFSFPIGTAIGGYALWALLNDQSQAYFTT
ncbi:MAG TPA: hypothetical protein VFL80_09480, partial [Thermoanaerobaculia bacterium]|nr:hypothetical protein [Thermoanaerobaculia bacterium]